MCNYTKFIQQILLIFFVILFNQFNSPFCCWMQYSSALPQSPSPNWFNHIDLNALEMNNYTTNVELLLYNSDDEGGEYYEREIAIIPFPFGKNATQPNNNELFFLDFGPIKIGKIACNSTLFELILEECKQKQCDKDKIYEEAWEKACAKPDNWNGPENVCTSANTAMMFTCWESRFQPGMVKPQFYVKNKPIEENIVARACGAMGQHMHGIGLGICVHKLDDIFSVHTTIQTSYSAKRYFLSTINLPMSEKMSTALNPLLLFKYVPAITKLLNLKGNLNQIIYNNEIVSQSEIVNNDESFSFNNLPMRPSAFENIIENDAIGFAWMDMHVEKVLKLDKYTNESTLMSMRKLHLHSINGENGMDICQIFSNMKVLFLDWGKDYIRLNGCEAMKYNKWNAKGNRHGISEDGLKVNGSEIDTYKVLAVLPIPPYNFTAKMPSIAFYFEVQILLAPSRSWIPFGFCTKQFALKYELLGEVDSIRIEKGQMRIDGEYIKIGRVNDEFEEGDVVGIGIIHKPNLTMECFAILNGKLLVKVELPVKFISLELFPVVIAGKGKIFRANFGLNEWWRFNKFDELLFNKTEFVSQNS